MIFLLKENGQFSEEAEQNGKCLELDKFVNQCILFPKNVCNILKTWIIIYEVDADIHVILS